MSTFQELQAGLGPRTNKSSDSASVAPISKGNCLFDVEVTNSTTAKGEYVLDHGAEKELCWKLDTRLVRRLVMGLNSLSP